MGVKDSGDDGVPCEVETRLPFTHVQSVEDSGTCPRARVLEKSTRVCAGVQSCSARTRLCGLHVGGESSPNTLHPLVVQYNRGCDGVDTLGCASVLNGWAIEGLFVGLAPCP